MNKKVTTVALAGLLAVSSVASASVSRWGGFGLSSTFIADVQDVWTLPTALLDNGDSLFVELGSIGQHGTAVQDTTAGARWISSSYANNDKGTAWGGVHFSLLGGQVGLWTNRPLQGVITVIAPGQRAIPDAAFTVANRAGAGIANGLNVGANGGGAFSNVTSDIDLLYGMSVNDNTQLAIGINKSSGVGGTQTTIAANNAGGVTGARTETKIENGASGFGVSLGLGMSEVGPLSGLWAGISWLSVNQTVHNVVGGAVTTSNGKIDQKDTRAVSDINLRLAGEVAGDNNMSQLFDVNVAIESNEDKREDKNDDIVVDGSFGAGETTTQKINNGGMGLGLGWAMSGSGEAGMALSGLILDYSSTTDKQENTTDAVGAGTPTTELNQSKLGLKWVAGGEVKAKEYLTLRAGVVGDIFGTHSAKTKSNTGGTGDVTQEREANGHVPGGATVSVGFSVPMGAFVFDAVANQDFLYSGPYFVSGVSEGLATNVSLTYAWGGQE